MMTPTPALIALTRLDGVTGVCLQRGSLIRWRDQPSISSEQANALCRAVAQTFRNYASAERPLLEAYFEFSGLSVLVVASPADWGTTEYLTFLLRDRTATAGAAKAAAACFRAAE